MFSPSAYKKAGLLTDRTNSPSQNPNHQYGKQRQQKRRSSAMDMLFTAHNEVKAEAHTERDAGYARNLHHNSNKEHQRELDKRRKEEEQNEQYAQKVQLEEHDSALAEHLHRLENNRVKQIEFQKKENEELSMNIARKLQQEEEKEAKLAAKQSKKIAAKDIKFARKVHKQNIQELKREEQQQLKREQKLIDDEKKSEQMAKNLHAQEERNVSKVTKEKQRQALKDEKIARKYHRNEMNYLKREENEKQRKLLVEKKEKDKMERMNIKSQKIAQRLQAEEHSQFMKDCERRQLQHEEDEKLARQMQGDELGDVALKSTSVRDAWNNPEVEVEETKSGAVITVQLPNVRRMEVDLDEDENCIFVNAIPKSADRVVAKLTDQHNEAHDELKKIVESQFVGSLKPVAFEIHLEEIVEGIVTADDIRSEYIAKTGMLRLELCGVVAKSKVEQKEFKKSLLSRLGNLFSRSRSKKSNKRK